MAFRIGVVGAAAFALAVGLGAQGAPAAEPAAVGTVITVSGTVQVKAEGAWLPAEAGRRLLEGQSIRTGEASSAEIRFDPDLTSRLGEKSEIAVADLLLKARLEKAKARIAAPAGDAKVELQVTPLTGVRGTEKAEEKAGDLKREHYWNEGAPPAK